MLNHLLKSIGTKYNLPLHLSILIFIVSLTQDCFCTTQSCVNALEALVGGALSVIFAAGFGSPVVATWLANPLLMIAWFKYKSNPKFSFFLSTLATLIALSFLLHHQIIANEGGGTVKITEIKLGYYLWGASILTMLTGSLREFLT